MTQKGSDTPIPDHATSRRLFFKFLAASPLAALAYSAAPSNWLEPLSGAEPSVGSAPVRCAGCGRHGLCHRRARDRKPALRQLGRAGLATAAQTARTQMKKTSTWIS